MGGVVEHGEHLTTARACVSSVVRVFYECTWSVVQTSLWLVGRVVMMTSELVGARAFVGRLCGTRAAAVHSLSGTV